MNALIVLLGILAAASAVPAHFPRGKVVTYKYTADVKAGIIEPAPFASNFEIDCHLQIEDVSNPIWKNVYRVKLTDVKYGLYNGRSEHYQTQPVREPIVDAANALMNPFHVVFDTNEHLQGVKFVTNEPGWSKNMKKAIVSMLQLDLVNINVQTPIQSHSFITREDTIHGNCEVAYNVHPVDHVHSGSNDEFVVTKIHESKNCTHFTHHEFNHVEPEKCHMQEADDMTTASRRVFVIKNQGSEVLIKKLVGHSVINYFPWMASSEAHYLLTNQTLFLEDVSPVTESQLTSAVENLNVVNMESVVYDEPKTYYNPQADVDVTHGRHVVRNMELVVKLKKMLDEAAGYLKEVHVEKKQPEWKHDQTINRILHVMRYMTYESLQQVFNEIENTKDAKTDTMKNIFLGVVPNVGTLAACLFTRDIVRTKSVPNWFAVTMLGNLPMHVKVPSKQLLLAMEELLSFDNSVSSDVRTAAILCFATLIHKTVMHEPAEVIEAHLNLYLEHFMNHIKNEPTHHMKVVYMMALKNIHLSRVVKLLEPIIRGEEVLSEKPHNMRVYAIWCIKHIPVDQHYIHDLLWPVLTNVTLPTVVRIAAFDVLMNQLPHLGRLMNIYWLMVYEKNEDLYNYYVDTIKGIANSVEPCLMTGREMAKKVLRFIRIRDVSGSLSKKFHFDYFDEKYGYSETVQCSLVVDQSTGLPYVGSLEHSTSVTRKPVNKLGIHWNIYGMDNMSDKIKHEVFGTVLEVIKNDNVKNVLVRAAADMPKMQDVNINVILTMNNNVVSTFHCNKDNFVEIVNTLKQWKELITRYMENVNLQTVLYDNYYEMHVPTDLGVPAVLASKMPSMFSLKGNVHFSEDTNLLSFNTKMKYQSFTHGEYVMSIYNPIVDVWHSIRRTSSMDLTIPCEMNVGYNQNTKSVKVTLSRLPLSDFSSFKVSMYGKNYVTLTGDENDLLKKFCSTCHHYEVVTNSINFKTYESNFDSKDLGIRFSMQHHCDKDFIPTSTVGEWLKTLLDEKKNSMGYHSVGILMAARHKVINDLIAGQEKNCWLVVKAEPSIIHPTSTIDLSGKASIQDLDFTHEKMHVLSSKRIDIRGNVNIKAASSNESVRQWDMNVNIMLSPGHVNNTMKVMITRTSPEENQLKICIDAQKEYPMVNTESMNTNDGTMETNSKMTITMGHTNEDKCVRDEMDVTMTMKGEVTEEQRKQIAYDRINGACVKQSLHSMFYTKSSHRPKTWECTQEAILHSTLRKYTVNMVLKKVPTQLVSTVNIMQDMLRVVSYPHMKYSWNHVEPKNAKIICEFPFLTHYLNTAVFTPTHSYELVRLPLGDPLWNMCMDNTHYSFQYLYKHLNGHSKSCTAYVRVLQTLDNGTIPFTVPDEWTLLSGDHVYQEFSVFVKVIQNSTLALKVYVGGHELEIMPTNGGVSMVVSMDNKVVDNYGKGVMVPENEPDSYAIKLTETYDHIVIESQTVPIKVSYIPECVTVDLDTVLQGHVTGVCGHMDGMHKVEIPKIYSVSHL